ncbi:DUF4179 domain-containing protein [Clostridium sp.]|uniref:DUF4179 domain-containing protein n=1 Tax=Clostridium sp. TaxID=1506 RepID=UPI002FCAEF1B
MNPKDILDNLDNENIEKIEMSKENLSEIEIYSIKKNIKKKLKKRNNKKKLVASAVAIALVGIISTPAIADNIPVINNIYKQFGFFQGYEKYTNYIGQSQERNGIKVTIENIIAVPNQLEAVVKIESREPLKLNPKEDNFMFNVNMDMNTIKSGTSTSSGGDSYYIDNNTMILNYKETLSGSTYPKKGDLSLQIKKLSEDFKITELEMTFDIKVDFTTAFKDKYNLDIKQYVNDSVKLNKLKSNAMGSELEFTGEDAESLNDVWGPKYCIEVDGKIYTKKFGSNMDFPQLTADVMRNANSINFIISDIKEPLKWGDDLDDIQIEMVQEGNIKYPKIITSQNGVKGEIYKVEWEGNKLKFYFRSEYEPINIFQGLSLSASNNDKDRDFSRYSNKYTIERVDDGYVAIFDGVEKNKNILLDFGDHIPLDNYKEAKVIKVK